MAHTSELIANDIHAYLKSQEEKGMLRFITCGSVDDGKSTLIGRLLWDSKMVFEDQLAALQTDSRRIGTQGEKVDYALLLDGLQAEREQGITIDVAYRFFSTDKRKFIVADTPGHEQYTRNMVTGASTAQVAVILIDARKGVLTQTKRHSYLVSLVGIRHVVLAVNKMDLVDYSAERFSRIRREYENFAAGLGFDQIAAIPISALEGDNVLARSEKTPWHRGPTLMEYLETVQVADAAAHKPFRMRVQWVNRPNLDFRGFCGTIASGTVRPGDEVAVASSGRLSRVRRIVTMDGDLEKAIAGQAVTLTLEDEIDISRGDTLAGSAERPYHADRLEAKVVWLHEEALAPGRSYILKAGSSTSPARVAELRFKVNVNSLQQEKGETLELNEVGVCSFLLDRPVSFDSYRENRGTGNFILIDRMTNATVGAGMIHQPLLHGAADQWTRLNIDRRARAERKGQRPRLVWLAGAEGIDTAALAALAEKKLHALGRHTYLLDGERRPALFCGTEPADRTRSLVELGRLFLEAGLIVLACSPAGAETSRTVRELIEEDELVLIELRPEGSQDTAGNRQALRVAVDGRSPEEVAEEIAGKIDFSARL